MISAFSCNTFSGSLFSAQSRCSLSSSIYYQKPCLNTYIIYIDWFGASLILPKINAHLFHFGNIQIQVIFITPIHKVFNLLVVSASSLLIFPTSSVSSANFITGHDSSVLLQSAIYSANKKGAKTVPWGAPVFVLILQQQRKVIHLALHVLKSTCKIVKDPWNNGWP